MWKKARNRKSIRSNRDLTNSPPVRPGETRARPKNSAVARCQGEMHAISVMLDLVQPFGALRRRVNQFAKLWLDPLSKTGRRAAGQISHRFCHYSRARSVGTVALEHQVRHAPGVYLGQSQREDETRLAEKSS